MRVEAGFDHENFILNFSRSSCFTELKKLDFGDFNEQYMDDYLGYRTPFEHYCELFQSGAFAGIQEFVLRNASLSSLSFQATRKDLDFSLLGI